jgi:hypothetical protein
MGVLGWDRVRAIDEEMALPLIRASIEETIRSGDVDPPIPVDTAADLLFSLYCNAVLFIASAPEPDQAAREAEVIFCHVARTAEGHRRHEPERPVAHGRLSHASSSRCIGFRLSGRG